MSFKRRKQVRVCDSFTGSIVGAQPGVKEILVQALASEIVAWEFYTRYLGFLSGKQVHAVESVISEFSWDELNHHARDVKQRLAVMGVDHEVTLANVRSLNPIPEVTSPACALHYITAVAYLEKKTVEFYKDAIKRVEQTGDVVTKNMLEEILKDEEDHLAISSRLACQLVADQYCSDTVILTYPTATVFKVNDGVASMAAFYNYLDGTTEPLEQIYVNDGDVAALIDNLRKCTVCEDYSQVCREVTKGNSCTLPSEGMVIAFNGSEALVSSDLVCSQVAADTVCDSVFKKFRNRELADSLKKVLDEMVDRQVNGKTVKVQKLNNGEDANKFLEKNKGFVPVDQDDQGVYVALESQTK